MLDVGRRIGAGGACGGNWDEGRRTGAGGAADAGATLPDADAADALIVGSGVRLRLGGGGGWLTAGRAGAAELWATAGGWLGTGRGGGGGGPAD